jgi:hypothetical protein
VAGFKVQEGVTPPSNILRDRYAELLTLHPQDSPNLGDLNVPISVTNPKLDSSLAKDSAKAELVKALSIKQRYRTARHVKVKILQPKKKDIEILDFQHVKVPILTGTYQLKNYTYRRQLLASTGQLILEELVYCKFCKTISSFVCENCGAIVCASTHGKACTTCQKYLCPDCTVSKGILSKKYYCKEHMDN